MTPHSLNSASASTCRECSTLNSKGWGRARLSIAGAGIASKVPRVTEDRDPRRTSMCITHGRAAIRVTIFLSGPFMLHCLKRFRRRQKLQLTRIHGGRSVISLQTCVGLTVASTATRGVLRRVSSRWGSSRWQMSITWSCLDAIYLTLLKYNVDPIFHCLMAMQLANHETQICPGRRV